MASAAAETARPSFFGPGRLVVAVIGTLLGICVIVVVLGLMLWTGGVTPISPPSALTPGGVPRDEALTQLRAEFDKKLTTYGWVDREKGIVRIPIDQAMEKLVAQHRQQSAPSPR